MMMCACHDLWRGHQPLPPCRPDNGMMIYNRKKQSMTNDDVCRTHEQMYDRRDGDIIYNYITTTRTGYCARIIRIGILVMLRAPCCARNTDRQ